MGAKEMINRTIHHTYLLEELTQNMIIDPDFMDKVMAHLTGKRAELGIATPGGLFRLMGPFAFIKTLSVDLGMEAFPALRRAGSFTERDISYLNRVLALNVREAALMDSVVGSASNAEAGYALASVPFTDARVAGPSRTLRFKYSRKWTSLYETWNLAFITGNLPNLNLFYPKLLIPSVVCAGSKDYGAVK